MSNDIYPIAIDGANYNVTVGTGLAIPTGMAFSMATVAAATYSVADGVTLVNVTYTPTGTVTVTLPSVEATSGRAITVKDAGGNSSANAITINTGGSETIDGEATATVNYDYASVSLYSDGTNWFIY